MKTLGSPGPRCEPASAQGPWRSKPQPAGSAVRTAMLVLPRSGTGGSLPPPANVCLSGSLPMGANQCNPNPHSPPPTHTTNSPGTDRPDRSLSPCSALGEDGALGRDLGSSLSTASSGSCFPLWAHFLICTVGSLSLPRRLVGGSQIYKRCLSS